MPGHKQAGSWSTLSSLRSSQSTSMTEATPKLINRALKRPESTSQNSINMEAIIGYIIVATNGQWRYVQTIEAARGLFYFGLLFKLRGVALIIQSVLNSGVRKTAIQIQ